MTNKSAHTLQTRCVVGFIGLMQIFIGIVGAIVVVLMVGKLGFYTSILTFKGLFLLLVVLVIESYAIIGVISGLFLIHDPDNIKPIRASLVYWFIFTIVLLLYVINNSVFSDTIGLISLSLSLFY